MRRIKTAIKDAQSAIRAARRELTHTRRKLTHAPYNVSQLGLQLWYCFRGDRPAYEAVAIPYWTQRLGMQGNPTWDEILAFAKQRARDAQSE